MSLERLCRSGKASFVLGGQFGSEGKGSCVAYMATHLRDRHSEFDIITTNNGPQSGHTSTHDGVTKVLFHLPTVALYAREGNQPLTYLNGGSIINPRMLLQELEDNPAVTRNFAIHPNAAIVTQDCIDAEMRDDSAQTKIASTRKGVGEALSRKVLRSGVIAKDVPELSQWVQRIDLNEHMARGASVLVEIPQGHSLSIDSQFYPHTTSRNCTVSQAMADAGIHPQFYHASMLVLRTYPIRVGNIEKEFTDAAGSGIQTLGRSGDCYFDQSELTWTQLGQKPETTTVTKRQRRVFSFSEQQAAEAIASTRPSVLYLTFCDYLPDIGAVRDMVSKLRRICDVIGLPSPEILTQWGPSTSDVIIAEDLWA